MLCKKALREEVSSAGSMNIRVQSRHRCYNITVSMANTISTIFICCVAFTFFTLPFEVWTEEQQEDLMLIIATLILIMIIILLRIVVVHIAKKCCIQNVFNNVFEHEFRELSEEEV
jgi:predicted membrane protein